MKPHRNWQEGQHRDPWGHRVARAARTHPVWHRDTHRDTQAWSHAGLGGDRSPWGHPAPEPVGIYREGHREAPHTVVAPATLSVPLCPRVPPTPHRDP